MFNWTISLSDRQVLMLMAFHSAEDDAEGSRFHSVHAMIGDAWDIRAVRKLQEQNLLVVEEFTRENGLRTNRWNITDKGTCICLAIEADTEMLGKLKLRDGLNQSRLINKEITPEKRGKGKAAK